MAYDGMEIGLLGLTAFGMRMMKVHAKSRQIDAENHVRTLPAKQKAKL